MDKYPKNRFIYSALETINIEPVEQMFGVLSQKVDRVYIHSLGKQQIRNLTKSILPNGLTSNDNIVDRAVLCIRNANLPSTPFIVSLVISACEENEEFAPINVSNVMENFLETLLEKNDIDSAKTSSYDYKIKEDFLCNLVHMMHTNNRFYLSQQEFEEFLQIYHQNKGWAIRDTHFDTLFFEKSILFHLGDEVAFRYSCIASFYLAKLALKSQEFLSLILDKDNYLFYFYELNFITGLERNCIEIYEKLNIELETLISEHLSLLNNLNDYGIRMNYSMDPSRLNTTLSKRLSLEQSDQISDNQLPHDVNDSSQMMKPAEQLTNINSMQKFLSTLIIYANILKNSELYDLEIKQKMMKNLAKGLCIALAMMIQHYKDIQPKILNEYKASLKDIEQDKQLTLEQVETFMEDTIKIVLPLVIENLAFENVGSTKLKSIFMYLFNNPVEKSDFSQFLLLFLYCDLRVPGCIQEISHFVQQTNSKDILTIIFFKTMYYYQMHYFPKSQDNALENLIADINLKLQGTSKFGKGCIINQIKKKRVSGGD